jgi:hypothetical protein
MNLVDFMEAVMWMMLITYKIAFYTKMCDLPNLKMNKWGVRQQSHFRASDNLIRVHREERDTMSERGRCVCVHFLHQLLPSNKAIEAYYFALNKEFQFRHLLL